MSSADLVELRKNIGICPQEDILYDLLNCEEHLELYAKLKGVASKEIMFKVMRSISLKIFLTAF